jgi:hypothetical protein
MQLERERLKTFIIQAIRCEISLLCVGEGGDEIGVEVGAGF